MDPVSTRLHLAARVEDAVQRFRKHVGPGMSRMAELAGMPQGS